MDTNELRAETIKIMKEMIPIKALAPENGGGEGELDRAEFLQGYIRPFFDEVRRVDAPDPRAKGGVRPNIVATTRGERMLWIIAHMDTVPEGGIPTYGDIRPSKPRWREIKSTGGGERRMMGREYWRGGSYWRRQPGRRN